MKYDILHVDDYLLIVDPDPKAEIHVKEICLFRAETDYLTILRDIDDSYKETYWKIMAHLPLNGADSLDKIPLLPDLMVIDETVNSISEFNIPVAFKVWSVGSGMFIPATQQTIGASNDWVGRYIYKEEEL